MSFMRAHLRTAHGILRSINNIDQLDLTQVTAVCFDFDLRYSAGSFTDTGILFEDNPGTWLYG